ncbi:MAG: hypothetical protein V1865_00080 [bacterium]
MKNSLSKAIVGFNYARKNFREIAGDYFRLAQSRIYLVILLFLNLIAWVMAHLLKINIDQELIFLHYNIIFGRDLVGPIGRIYFWPIIGLGIIILNIAIVLGIYKRYKVLTQILLITSAICNGLLILALYSLYLVNFVSI